MPYKFNESRRHKIPVARYRVINWPEYDAALVRRSCVTVAHGRRRVRWRGRLRCRGRTSSRGFGHHPTTDDVGSERGHDNTARPTYRGHRKARAHELAAQI